MHGTLDVLTANLLDNAERPLECLARRAKSETGAACDDGCPYMRAVAEAWPELVSANKLSADVRMLRSYTSKRTG
jgi:hypothetical protein